MRWRMATTAGCPLSEEFTPTSEAAAVVDKNITRAESADSILRVYVEYADDRQLDSPHILASNCGKLILTLTFFFHVGSN